jgi:F5/8 type C domain-containing protein
MKRCPKCKRKYDDETLRFCLEDGTPLFDARDSEAPSTEIMPGRGVPTLRSSGPTAPTFPASGAPPSNDRVAPATNPLLTGGVIAIALLLLVLVGIVAFFVIRQSSGNEAARTDNRGSSPTVKEGSASPGTNNQQTGKPDTQTSPDSQPGTPLKITASASSVRLAVQANTYYAANAIDGKRSTAWIEGVDGPGLGEWIRFEFDREINLHRILIQPGYFKSPQIWAENNRLETVTVYFSDGSSRDLTFANRMDSQKVDVGAIRTRWVRFVIKSVHYGTDPDTAISEVAFEWDQ